MADLKSSDFSSLDTWNLYLGLISSLNPSLQTPRGTRYETILNDGGLDMQVTFEGFFSLSIEALGSSEPLIYTEDLNGSYSGKMSVGEIINFSGVNTRCDYVTITLGLGESIKVLQIK